jgi:LysR family transcriptional regulator, glycine cleavage system transcriptional activator
MSTTRRLLPLLNALPVFEEAARRRSFTRAAESLGMAQPSVSRFIANLEDQLGVALFDRQHNKITLTPEGEQFFEATRLGLGHIRMAIENLDNTVAANILTILCTQGFAHLWFLPRRTSLAAHLQGYEIHLATTETLTDHVPRSSDIEIRFGRGNWENKEAHLLFDEIVFAVCSPAYALHHGLAGKNLTLQSIADLPLLVQDRGEMGWMSWQGWFTHFGGRFAFSKDQYFFNNYALTLQAAMEGKGIALAWAGLADSHLSNNWLVALDGMEIRTGQGYYLVFSPTNPVAAGLRQWAAEIGQHRDQPGAGNVPPG